MLYYNIYTNISDDQFLEIRKRLVVIECKFAEALESLGWKMTMPVRRNDALAVDFTLDEEEFFGNIGLMVNDEPGVLKFTFYLTKGYDKDQKRYWVKRDIVEDKELEYFEQNIEYIIQDTLEQYNSLEKSDMEGLDSPGF